MFVSRIDGAQGNVQWVKQFGQSVEDDRPTDLALVMPRDEQLGDDEDTHASQLLVVGHTKKGIVHDTTSGDGTSELFIVTLNTANGDILLDGSLGVMTQNLPTEVPTQNPPTDLPTDPPIDLPPTELPTEAPPPTELPTEAPPPTEPPTEAPPPTDLPTEAPTDPPTEAPSSMPTEEPQYHADASIARDGRAFQSNWGPSYSGAAVYDFTRRKYAIHIKKNDPKNECRLFSRNA
jgi:outer membrane biosynthesis protein TonB